MRVNSTDPIPTGQPEPRKAEHRVEPRPTQPAVGPAAHLETAHPDATSVLVEIQKDNMVVYRFIDSSTGKVIQQIPSQEMINFSRSIDEALSSKRKPEGKE